ncbi:uncharacterized protein LOC126905829 isoform X2 [Daktulosphaira vitifoliae]|uniref:uncharacterized protein LOC126905829 isoform X2 n=1 Tax=Daktulosphaira vitifoliae TaxID=58002 RepID=UPI0021A9CFF7|nr:uncharacterized protein LOC126905829 isoform X2 [Daktulosphaira vitifoliae]
MILIILILLWCGHEVELVSVQSHNITVDTNQTDAKVSTGRDAKSNDSMSTNTNYYGVQFYTPPLIHQDLLTPSVYTQPVRPSIYQRHGDPLQQLHQEHQQHSTTPDSHPILINPLIYDEPVTKIYPQKPSSAVARTIKYTEPGPGSGYRLPFVSDETLNYDSLPRLHFAQQYQTKPLAPAPTPIHQYIFQQHTKPIIPFNHPLNHKVPRRYFYNGDIQLTNIPLVYTMPVPPALEPAEYDLVTRFNQLLKQRERDKNLNDEEDKEEEEEKPITNKKKKSKKKKKKKKKPTPQPPDEEELEEETENTQENQQQDEPSEQGEQEEQETKNVVLNEEPPEITADQNEDHNLQNIEETENSMIQHFNEDLSFQDGTGERVEFQMHGIEGPDSYKFGFDTGNGINRQFRYEERDANGHVRGHYGYRDGDGKLQIYNYTSHPEFGFQSQKVETLES